LITFNRLKVKENSAFYRIGIEENCRLRQKYSICLLEEVVVLGYFADKAQVYRKMFCESVLFLIALQHDYGCLQSTYCVQYFSQLRGYID